MQWKSNFTGSAPARKVAAHVPCALIRIIRTRAQGRARPPQQLRGYGIARRWKFVVLLLLAIPTVEVLGSDGQIVAAPLAERSGPRGATMFTALDPALTGVVTENNYADPEMWTTRDKEFALGAIGTGIAVGDCDGDGRPDIFVVSKTEACRLFRNLGNWKFRDVTAEAGLGAGQGWTDAVKSWVGWGGSDEARIWKQGASFADVDNDGRLDLYLCRFGAPNRLYMNQGDGTFREEAAARGLALSDGSGVGAFCDYDRDGGLDVYIQTNVLDAAAHPNGQRDRLFRNNGDGRFTDVTDQAGISGETLAHAATWWDYDGDDWPDLYVANDFAPSDNLYRNNRDGTFTDVIDQVVPHQPYSSMGADFGDVDNDGRIDFLASDMAATTHEKDQRGMASSREINAVSNRPTGAPQYPRNALYLNTGLGVMREAAQLAGLAATDWTWAVRLEDLDNDGRLDAFFTNGMVREFQNADLRDQMVVAESLTESRRIVRSSPVLAEPNLAFRNLGQLQFENIGHSWGLDQAGVSFGAAFADFDGDGDLDLVFANYQAGVTLLRNDCSTGHRITVALRGRDSNRYGIGAFVRVETADAVQVRSLAVVRGYLSSSEPILHFGLGDETRLARLTVEWPSGHTQIFTDLAVDQRYTITEPTTDRPPVKLAKDTKIRSQFHEIGHAGNLNLSTRETQPPDPEPNTLQPVGFNRRGPGLAVGDLNGDSQDDLVIGGTSGEPARVLLAHTAGQYVATDAGVLANRSGLSDGPVLVFDADGDGTNDMLITRAGAGRPAGASEYQPQLWLNDGHANFRPAPPAFLPAELISAGAATVTDFDRDGRLDLFLGARVLSGRYPRAPRSALLANRGGRFEDVTDALAPALREIGMVTSALWTDVDGDGWLDLLLALEWGGIHYWHNNGGRGFEDRSQPSGFSAAGSGWWTSLAAADFNRDGRMDYVAGNVGLNTPYHASPQQPAVLFYGEFGGSGRPLEIEASYEGEHLYPWRTRKALGLSSVLRRFPKNNAYAKATLEEILGKERLQAAERYTATEFASGVFLSQSDGTFRFERLPRIAQIAPFQGVVAGDFDGDSKADIYAVQNSYAPNPTVGRFDGGLSQLLLGDGRGNFAPVEPAGSGLIVPGDGKALVVLDLDDDGWPDFVVTQNNRTTLAFRNGGVTGRHAVRVGLRGPAGNSSAVGARLTLELADGSTQTGEIHGGSGYYSQSTAACFFGWPDNNPPRRLLVRWPSGATSEHVLAHDATSVTHSAP